MISNEQINEFNTKGFLVLDTFLSSMEIERIRVIYDLFLSNHIESNFNRSDLSGAKTKDGVEKITQIMRPSTLSDSLAQENLYKRVQLIADKLFNRSMNVDFDMLIDKAPLTNTITPWHQDEAYWLDMPDKSAVSCWIALDDVYEDNGCMWFEPESHKKGLKHHDQIGKKGALVCDGSESKSISVVLPAGGCTFHHGRTLHYSRGNSTMKRRRALIVNLRPPSMIMYERDKGCNHTGKIKLRNNV